MNMEAVLPEEIESTRMVGARNEAEVLRAVARVTQVRAAACMEVHASTISRTLEDLPRWAQLLAALGLQVTPTDSMVVDRSELTALENMALRYLEIRRQERVKGGLQ